MSDRGSPQIGFGAGRHARRILAWQLPASGELRRAVIPGGLEAEEIVGLWNVVFPEDRNVWYDDETKAIHFNEEMAGYAD